MNRNLHSQLLNSPLLIILLLVYNKFNREVYCKNKLNNNFKYYFVIFSLLFLQWDAQSKSLICHKLRITIVLEAFKKV